MTGMKTLSQILTELANHGSWEGYGLLHYAIEEAVKEQPMPPGMDKLRRKLVRTGGKQNPESIYRSMARAVDDIWDREDSRRLLKEYYRRELVEKPTLDGFISALARYLWEQSEQQAEAPYQMTFDIASQKYGIIIHMKGSDLWASFPAFTKDPDRVRQIIRILVQRRVTLEEFRAFYLSGGLEK